MKPLRHCDEDMALISSHTYSMNWKTRLIFQCNKCKEILEAVYEKEPEETKQGVKNE